METPLIFLDNRVALKQLEKAHEASNFVELNFQRLNEGSLQQNATPAANLNIRLYALLAWPKAVSNRMAKAKGKSLVPRIITLGGDHTYVRLIRRITSE